MAKYDHGGVYVNGNRVPPLSVTVTVEAPEAPANPPWARDTFDRMRAAARQHGKSEMLRYLYGGRPTMRVIGAEEFTPSWLGSRVREETISEYYARVEKERADALAAAEVERKRKEDAIIGRGKMKFYRRPPPKNENQMEMFG